MAGDFPLTSSSIEEHSWPGWAGAYILKHTKGGPPRYVGRSDTNITRRLKEQARDKDYSYFRVEHKDTALDAWVREANLYHRHKNKLDNEDHPNPPEGYSCPRCNGLDAPGRKKP